MKRLTSKLGVPDKYNETITWFFLLLIDERRAAAPGADWQRFRAANAELMRSQGTILRRYYNAQTLSSERAKRVFVLPDQIPA